MSYLLICLSAIAAESQFELGALVEEGVGQDWVLADGQVANLQIIESQFHLFFLDQERLIVTPPVEKAIVRGEGARNRTNRINVILRVDSGPALTHPRNLFPPYDYWLLLLIPSEEIGEEWESLSRVRFRQASTE